MDLKIHLMIFFDHEMSKSLLRYSFLIALLWVNVGPKSRNSIFTMRLRYMTWRK